MKTRFALVFISLLFVSPFAASALTSGELQARVQALFAQIAELTAQIKSLQGQVSIPSIVPGIPVGTAHRVCSVLERNLSQGARGDDVKSVQEFLRTEGYLNADATGYFGVLTSEALRRWQASQGVDAVGVLGPKTKERIRIWCGGGGAGDLNVSPARGTAPLSVVFLSKIGDGTIRPSAFDGQDTVLDFGDGSEPYWVSCGDAETRESDRCATPVRIAHTYTKDGTYTATLKKIGGFCAGGCAERIIAKAVITVGGGSVACTKEYKPVCGLKQVTCITAPCNPVPTTYSNACMLRADGATLAYEGACRTDANDPSLNPQCRSWYDGCNSCSRSESNGPAMCTLRACTAESMQKPYCTGYFGDSGKAPNISGFSGPTTLHVNQTGTWTVKASDPDGGQLSYIVSWGDEVQYASGISTSLPVFTQTSSFTHSYSSPGTYVVSVTARDVDGKEAKVSITVKVSSDAVVCTTQYDPVCGRPTGCANTCAPGMFCTLECRLYDPKTYSNRCALDAAGAEYLYGGACTQ